jgi:hypothetical protein
MGWAVGIRPRQLLSLGNNVLDLVQPCVLVHAVDVDTGQYGCVGVPVGSNYQVCLGVYRLVYPQCSAANIMSVKYKGLYHEGFLDSASLERRSRH